MANSKTKDTPPDGAENAVEPPAANGQVEASGFDWNALGDSIAMPTRAVAADRKVDAIAETPAPIRQRIETSLMKTVARYAAKASSTAKRVRVDPYWSVQPVKDEAMGNDFIKKATRYAKYRPAEGEVPFADSESPRGQITVRCGKVMPYRKTEDGEVIPVDLASDDTFWGVRYSARPFEGRKGTARMPGR
jgi:hypothetical protein